MSRSGARLKNTSEIPGQQLLRYNMGLGLKVLRYGEVAQRASTYVDTMIPR